MSELIIAELVYNSIRPDVKSREDALLCFFHAVMLTNRFRCLGTGEDFSAYRDQSSDGQPGSVQLPSGWNADQNVYSLMYRRDDKKLVLVKAAKASNRLIIAVTVDGAETTSCTITTNRFVSEDLQNFQQLYSNLAELKDNLKATLLDRAAKSDDPKIPKQSSNFQLGLQEKTGALLRSGLNLFGGVTQGPAGPQPTVPTVGQADLNPFAPGGIRGGGMLLDPRSMLRPGQQGINQPGAPNIPGIRYDPIIPQPRLRNPNPDPNNLNPPGFENNFL